MNWDKCWWFIWINKINLFFNENFLFIIYYVKKEIIYLIVYKIIFKF